MRSLALLCVLALAGGACGGPTSDGGTATSSTPAASGDDPATRAVAVANSSLGPIVVDGRGKTLYLLVPDNQGASTCYDDCAEAWPPLTGTVDAGEGIDPSLLGTTPREDGPDQVTYNGWPLYYFADDSDPGDIGGQGVNDVWYAVNGAGVPVRAATGGIHY